MKLVFNSCFAFCFILFSSFFSDSLSAQKLNQGDIIVQAGIAGQGVNTSNGTKSIPIIKLSVGRVGNRYFNDNAFAQTSLMLGYHRSSFENDTISTVTKTYYFSPRVDFQLDKLSTRADIYIGFQPNVRFIDFDSDSDGRTTQYRFDIQRSLIVGLAFDFTENAGMYIEAYGIGSYNFGYRHHFRRNKTDANNASSG